MTDWSENEKSDDAPPVEPAQPEQPVPSLEPAQPPEAAGWRWENRQRRRNPAAATLAVVAVVSAVIGGIVASMLYPYIGNKLGFGAQPYLSQPPQGGTQAPAAPNLTDPPAVYVNQKVGPAVVGVIARQNVVTPWGQRGQTSVSGTGVIFAADGYIVTNNHVVEGAASLMIILDNSTQVAGRLIGADPASDLAVIKIEMTGLPVAEFGDSDRLRVGDVAVAIGNPVDPEAFQRTVTQGVISGLNRKIRQGERILTLLQTDAAINPGNSGGPLCNAAGQVIGINVAKIPSSQNVEGIGLTIPINGARPIINELIQNGRIARAWLGVNLLEKDQALAYRGVKFDSGIYVDGVGPGTPAAKAGLRAGDVIVKIDSTVITNYVDLRTFLDGKRPGQSISIVVVRGGSQVTVTAQLIEIPTDLTQ